MWRKEEEMREKKEKKKKMRDIKPASISLADVSKGTKAISYQCSCLLRGIANLISSG
jgi:hypothetical protein